MSNRFEGLEKPDALELHRKDWDKLNLELDKKIKAGDVGSEIKKKMEKLNKEFREHFNL